MKADQQGVESSREQGRVLHLLGMIVAEIDEERAARKGLGRSRGVVVLGPRMGCAASRAGVLNGDIICEVNGLPVTTLEELETALAEGGSADPIRMLFFSSGSWRFLAVPGEEKRRIGARV